MDTNGVDGQRDSKLDEGKCIFVCYRVSIHICVMCITSI